MPVYCFLSAAHFDSVQVFKEDDNFEFTPNKESRVDRAAFWACSNFLLLTQEKKITDDSIAVIRKGSLMVDDLVYFDRRFIFPAIFL
jgi:hypothetical protein